MGRGGQGMGSQRIAGRMGDMATLVLRLVLGLFMAGHGSQKLFGWFKGPGLQDTSQFMESIGLQPGRPWAITAGLSEFGGGLLMILGLLNPVGPLGGIGSRSEERRVGKECRSRWS